MSSSVAGGSNALLSSSTSTKEAKGGGTGDNNKSSASGGGGGGEKGKNRRNSSGNKTNKEGRDRDRDSANAGGGVVGSGGGGGGSSSNNNNSRSYPRGVGLDFRKLAGPTLLGYVDHHGVSVRAEAPPSELAVMVARHFEHYDAVDEEECIGGFLERLEKGGTMINNSGFLQPTEYARQTAFFDGTAETLEQRKRKRSKYAARQREQVAAKVTRTDENGSWILASVQRFYPDTETYDVQDEDDTSKLIRLPWSHVMRLSTGTEGCFQKDKDCMAIFPETTSFYRAKVSKAPVWKLDPRSGNPMVKEIIVKFEDDEDAQGRTPHRRVPSRYVIPIPQDYFYSDESPSSSNQHTTNSTNSPSPTATTTTTAAAANATPAAANAANGTATIGESSATTDTAANTTSTTTVEVKL